LPPQAFFFILPPHFSRFTRNSWLLRRSEILPPFAFFSGFSLISGFSFTSSLTFFFFSESRVMKYVPGIPTALNPAKPIAQSFAGFSFLIRLDKSISLI